MSRLKFATETEEIEVEEMEVDQEQEIAPGEEEFNQEYETPLEEVDQKTQQANFFATMPQEKKENKNKEPNSLPFVEIINNGQAWAFNKIAAEDNSEEWLWSEKDQLSLARTLDKLFPNLESQLSPKWSLFLTLSRLLATNFTAALGVRKENLEFKRIKEQEKLWAQEKKDFERQKELQDLQIERLRLARRKAKIAKNQAKRENNTITISSHE